VEATTVTSKVNAEVAESTKGTEEGDGTRFAGFARGGGVLAKVIKISGEKEKRRCEPCSSRAFSLFTNFPALAPWRRCVPRERMEKRRY
jgi:hypothetical protein